MGSRSGPSIWLLWLLLLFQVIQLAYGAKAVNCDPKKNKGKCTGTKAPKIPKTASFDDWSNWATLFPTCNPANNKFLSPINIETKKAVEIDEQTLIVYSGDPVDVYTYSSLYRVDDVAIEALNIGLRNKEVYRDATYISGLGNPEYRFFQRAMILFTKQEVEKERSLHQINGKRFPMEIVFFFADLQKTDQTQIHVLFEVSDVGNPAWFWNLEATAQLNQLLDTVGTDNAQKDFTEVKQKYEKASKSLGKLIEKQKNETDNDSYEAMYKDLELLHKLVGSAEDIGSPMAKRKVLLRKMESINKLVNHGRESVGKLDEKLQIVLDEVERQRRTGELQRGQENSYTDLVLELKDKKAHLLKTLTKTQEKVILYEQQKHDLDNDINGKTALLKKYKIGKNITNYNFKSVKEVAKKKKQMEEKSELLKAQKDIVSNLFNEMETKNAMEPRDVIIPQKFQISWLLPAIGGYYRYNGSAIVPPCKKRTHVIVMEQSVKLLNVVFDDLIAGIHKGRKQAEIDTFTGDAQKDLSKIDGAIPRLQKLGDRKIWYNRKNLQYKLDDGWHMKSSLRRKLKDAMMKSQAQPANHISFILPFHLLVLQSFLNSPPSNTL